MLVVRILDHRSSTLCDATTNDDVIDNDNTTNVIIIVVVVVVDVVVVNIVVVVRLRATDVKRRGILQPAICSNSSILF